jgi:hypothetical protein
VGGRRGERRLPLREAAEQLGVSKDALRQRIKRDTIRSDKGEDGRVYVYVDATTDASTHASADQPPDRTEELITTLREQLQAERHAHAEARRLLAAALERIPPQIEPPRDSPVSPSSAEEAPTPADADEAPQTPTSRPWWQRWFGSVDR